MISVDLPAPLSPSTQVTSPALTLRLMPSRALTLPKYLVSPASSSTGFAPSESRVAVALSSLAVAGLGVAGSV